MAKKGMKRPEIDQKKSTAPAVPVIQGKAKSGKEKANPLIANTEEKVYHSTPHKENKGHSAFAVMDNDLAIENLANDFDLTAADLQDFSRNVH